MRKSSGLRNKYRSGRGNYTPVNADNYGTWNNGIQVRSERINGHVLTYDNHRNVWR